jgi:hypothetical protein
MCVLSTLGKINERRGRKRVYVRERRVRVKILSNFS